MEHNEPCQCCNGTGIQTQANYSYAINGRSVSYESVTVRCPMCSGKGVIERSYTAARERAISLEHGVTKFIC